VKGIKQILALATVKNMRRKYVPAPISLPYDIQKIKNVLVCLPPDQRELTMIKQLLPEVSKVFANAEIYLLASPGKNVYDIFPRKGYRIMFPTSNHINWMGLPSKRYIDALKENKYDIILDLNLSTNLFAQMILLSFPSAIKIGKGNFLGSPYYNIEIKTKYIRDEKNIYKSMLETVNALKNPAINN
jgi:hypothetical protein